MRHEIVLQTPILDKQTYSAPMSFIGSTPASSRGHPGPGPWAADLHGRLDEAAS
jgi:hypothetical protein